MIEPGRMPRCEPEQHPGVVRHAQPGRDPLEYREHAHLPAAVHDLGHAALQQPGNGGDLRLCRPVLLGEPQQSGHITGTQNPARIVAPPCPIRDRQH